MLGSWVTLAVLATAGVGIAAFVGSRRRKLAAILSRAHFEELHELFVTGVRAAESSPDAEPDPEAGTAFVTSAGIGIGISAAADDAQRLHVSISQVGTVTTSAVASRVAFFVLATLGRNKLAVDPFVTHSRVHHLEVAHQHASLAVRPFAEVFAAYEHHYEPLPFRLETL